MMQMKHIGTRQQSKQIIEPAVAPTMTPILSSSSAFDVVAATSLNVSIGSIFVTLTASTLSSSNVKLVVMLFVMLVFAVIDST